MRIDYTKNEAISVLKNTGLKSGDTLLMHSDIFRTGFPEGFDFKEKNLCKIIYDLLFEVIGDTGTLVVPTFTYSFCKGEIFDPINTRSDVGAFSNWLMSQKGARRNHDPNFSFCILGKNTNFIFANTNNNSFDPYFSVYANLQKINCKYIAWGFSSNDKFNALTSIHFAEQQINSPHRYNKIFTGYIKRNSKLEKESWVYPVRVNIHNTVAIGSDILKSCLKAGVMKIQRLGNSFITSGSLNEIMSHYKQERVKNNWAFLTGPICDLVAEDKKRSGSEDYQIKISSTNVKELAEKLYPINRNIVSDGYDAALCAIEQIIPMTIQEFKTGGSYYSWIVPERWYCKIATITKIDGTKIISSNDNILHVMSYSLPVEKRVSNIELKKHIYYSNKNKKAIPFIFKYYERDWGFCLTKNQADALIDDYYDVKIDSYFTFSSLKIGEIIKHGSSNRSFIFCAHLCHPYQMADGLSGVIAGIKLMEFINNFKNTKYTYQFIIVPETIGSVAWLSNNANHLSNFFGGLFLEMLSTKIDYHTLMHSNFKNSYVDRVFSYLLRYYDKKSIEVDYLQAPLNDERNFNSQGIEIPMCSLMRILPLEDADWPYKEYHTHLDNLENSDLKNIIRSVSLLKIFFYILENDAIPSLNLRCEPFISRYNSPDYSKFGSFIRKVLFAVDGKKTILDICNDLNLNFFKVLKLLKLMENEKIISLFNLVI